MNRSSQQSTALRFLSSGVVLLASLLSFLPQPPQAVAAGAARISGFPSVAQWYNLSCEYASGAAVTLYWGNVVSQRVFVREVPHSPNPHLGFRGNINGPFGGIYDYGVYAEALVPVLERHGYNVDVFYGGADRLRANLAAGNPVVVWLTVGRDVDRPGYYRTYQGERFKLVAGEHAVVAYGYDSGGVRLMDVSDGGFYYTDWSSFLRRWDYFDEMSLVIYPK